MKLDRELQHTLLKLLAANYPDPAEMNWHDLGITKKIRDANLCYLIEHGLVKQERDEENISRGLHLYTYTATAKGMDFLADDGGLSAILGVITIKLHDDTIKSLIEGKILQSDLPEPEKKRFLDKLRELPAETTKHLVLKLVDLGLEKAPTAIETIGKFLTGT